MNPKDFRTLKLLEAYSDNARPTQRELARELDISLGLVNTHLKKLVQEGFLKINSDEGSRNWYKLTSKGKAEKDGLTYDYHNFVFEFYITSRTKFTKLFNNLYEQGIRRVAFYGVDELSEIAYISLIETSIKLVAVADTKKSGEKFFDFEIINIEKLLDISFQKLIATAYDIDRNTLNYLIDFGFAENNILMLSQNT